MEDKVIVVVGGTSGIGRAVANALIKKNTVLIVGRNEEKAKRFVEQNTDRAHYRLSDVSLLSNLPPLVNEIKSALDNIDFIVHTTDLLRTKRLNTAEGLEVSIATNYFSRVLFNQLVVGQDPTNRPERILHIAYAGFRPPKRFLEYFPLPENTSSFKAHLIGQVANDFYGLFMSSKLKPLGVKINVLNAGAVDTSIRRDGQFPVPIKLLIKAVERVMSHKIRSPEAFAKLPLDVMSTDNPDADPFTLISSKGKGIQGGAAVNDAGMQEAIYQRTTEIIDKKLGEGGSLNWL